MQIVSIQSLVDAAEETGQAVWQVVLADEEQCSGASFETIRAKLEATYRAMQDAALGGLSSELRSVSGLTGGDAAKYYNRYKNQKALLGPLAAKAVAYAVATTEYNAAMGVIVASPAASAAGILPGVLIAAQREYNLSDKEIINGLLTASGVGCVLANRASLSGRVGGCQAECGSAGAMAAAALCEVCGGTPRQTAHAAALALKNALGLVCDPVAGLVEIPCVKRNGIFAAIAITAADMALAGVESFIPPDEVIDTMYQIGLAMPVCFRETGEGGLAISPTGLRAKKQLFKE